MAERDVERRLAAIVAADVVGYSRLMEADEAGTLAQLKALRRDLIEPKIAEYRGRVVKTTGDGTLVEYASVTDAVQCNVDIQHAMAQRNASVPEERRMRFRVGINLGEIIIEGDDIYGNGVNVAARLEALAEPGGICISGKVYDEVRSKIDVSFDDLGEQTVKNIAQPIRAYHTKSETTANDAGLAAPGALMDKPAVAVLPFDNLSGDREQEYFSDGLSEDIITLLSAWRSFPVVARHSSFAFKGRSSDIRQIARELAAQYVIEGSVRKAGNRVRVTAQLIDAETGHQIWAGKYDGALDDIFEIQDNITRQIVSVVEPEMEKAERTRSATKRATNLSAWDYYLQGRELLHGLVPAQNVRARELFETALELDPDYSDAWAGLSQTYTRDILLETTEDRAECERRAIELGQKAVALDGASSVAHLALGTAYTWANQIQLGIVETRKAAELNPSNGLAWLALGNRLDIAGESDEGIALLERSLELHPRDPHGHIYLGQLARAHIVAGSCEKAFDLLNQALLRRPDYPHTYHLLAICLGHLGRIDEARDAAQKCEEIQPGFMARRTPWNIYVNPEANARLHEGLRKSGLAD